MRPTWPSDTARRIGLSGAIEFTTSRVGLTLHVPCQRGKHTVDVGVSPGSSPEKVAKIMLTKGWTFGTKLACPDCGRASAKLKTKEIEVASQAKAAPEAATPPATAPSDAAKRAHRLVMMLLEEGYDENKKVYKAGYSDASIAQETGAAEAHVRKTREDYFGPLGEPAELAELRVELERLRLEAAQTYTAIEAKLSDAGTRIASLCRANGWAVPA